MKELNGLTGLRFLAALYLFMFHMQAGLGLKFLPGRISNIVSEGALGVNAFFVLSGFILVYAHLKDYPVPTLPSRAYYGRFLIKRVARLYPAYLLCLLVCLPLYLAFRLPVAFFPATVVLDLALLETYIPSLSMEFVGGGGWSISCEFFFYLLFPFLLPLLLKLRSKRQCLWLLAGVLVLASAPGAYSTLHQSAFFRESYSFGPARLPEFVAGMLLGLLVLRYNFRVSEWGALGLLFAVALLLSQDELRLPGFTVYNLVVLPVILALIGVLVRVEDTRLLKWVGTKPMQYLGKISYSFFIIQIPITLVIFGLKTNKMLAPESSYLLLPLFVLNLALAIALYELVEKKAHRFIISQFLPKKVVPQSSMVV